MSMTSAQRHLRSRIGWLTTPATLTIRKRWTDEHVGFPYALRYPGWKPESDPFELAAQEALAEVEAGTRPAWW